MSIIIIEKHYLFPSAFATMTLVQETRWRPSLSHSLSRSYFISTKDPNSIKLTCRSLLTLHMITTKIIVILCEMKELIVVPSCLFPQSPLLHPSRQNPLRFDDSSLSIERTEWQRYSIEDSPAILNSISQECEHVERRFGFLQQHARQQRHKKKPPHPPVLPRGSPPPDKSESFNLPPW